MNWFQGSIPEGIQIARLSKGFLVVFVYDKEEASVDSRTVLDMKEFSDQIVLPEFTAIELENGSQNAKQFAEIYPLVTVPCLYFIDGVSGVPLEVIGGKVQEEYLRTKLSELSKLSTKDETQGAEVSPTEPPKDDPSPCATAEPLSTPGTSSNSEALGGTVETTAQDPDTNLQEKVERARILAEQIQMQKQKEAEEDERRKEVERRKIGMEMAKAKARREELELEQALKQRKKDKEEERLARERVKAQIAADKAEREARAARARGDMQETMAQPSRPVPVAPIDKDCTVRIKFRLSDGSSNIGLFKAEDKLTALHDHLHQNVPSLPSSYRLVSALDGSKLTDEHLSSTLAELNLAPSAIVIVKASSSQNSSTLNTNFDIMNFLWVPMTYLSMIVTTVFRFLGIGTPVPEQSQPEGNPPEPKRPRTDEASPRDSRGTYRRERNIHRLRDGADEDPDENNTWNGNSTQQM